MLVTYFLNKKKIPDNITCIHKFKIYYTKDRNITSVLPLFHVDILYVCSTELDTVMPVITVTVVGRWD